MQQQRQPLHSISHSVHTAVAHNLKDLYPLGVSTPALQTLHRMSQSHTLAFAAGTYPHAQPESHGTLFCNTLLSGRTRVSDLEPIQATARAYSTSHMSTPASGGASSIRTRGSRREDQAKQDPVVEYPVGSERWKKWTHQLQLGGLSQKQADSALPSATFLLQSEPPNTDGQFRQLAVSLLRDTGLTAEQFKQLLMVCPEFLSVTQTDGLAGNLNWFKVILGVSTVEWMQLALSCPPLAMLRKDSLQRRLNMLTGMGLDRNTAKACWMQNPLLIKFIPAAMQEKLDILQALFSISGAEIVKQRPEALMMPSRSLRDRVLFLQLLGGAAVSLQDVQLSTSDPEFALQTVGAHMRASGKTLPQLVCELQAMPGVLEYLEKQRVDAATMTAHAYFLVATVTARPPQVSSVTTVEPPGG